MTEADELAVQLCVQAGMIMEDVSPVAIIGSAVDLEQRVARIAAAGRDITILAEAAAITLKRRSADGSLDA